MKTSHNLKKGCALTMAALMMTGTMMAGCGPANANPSPEETTQSTQNTAVPAFAENSQAAVAVQSVTLPNATWQNELTFPNWAGYVDDTLALNSMYTFTTYHGQGKLYITPAEGVTGFSLFVNNQPIDTNSMVAGQTWEVDISDYTLDGANTIQLSNIQPGDMNEAVKVNIPYPIVLEGTPEEVGIDSSVLDTISSIVESDVEHGFTSAQMAIVKDGRLVYQNAWGTVNAYNPDGTPKTDSTAVTNETLYDLASNTKMYSVNYALQYLVSQGKVDLDSRIVDLLGQEFVDDTISIKFADYDPVELDTIKQWKSELTIRDILRHQAGFPADPQYHNDAFDQTIQKPAPGVENVLYSGSDGSSETHQNTLKSIFKTPLMYEPGTKTVYSDVDYMLLGFVIEKVTGKDLQTFLSETFWQPMGLTHVTYNPLQNGFNPEDCAATELNGNTRDGAVSFTGVRTNTLQGQVHDEKAYYAMGGVSGHAGLFANATDLAKLASVMLSGGYGENKFFDQNVMDTFTAPKKEDAANWGLGWWREAEKKRAWYFGTQSSNDTIGHQGWTGTLTLIDPDENLVVVYLTNKINSPVTDPEANPNKFDGNWYTSATLGFVGQMLYQGVEDRAGDAEAAMSALLADMVNSKFKLIAEAEGTLSAEHPLVRAGYALMEVLFDRAEKSGSDADWQYAKDALSLLDSTRDEQELTQLQEALQKAGKS